MHGVSFCISKTADRQYFVVIMLITLPVQASWKWTGEPIICQFIFLEGRNGVFSTVNFQYKFRLRSNVGQDL